MHENKELATTISRLLKDKNITDVLEILANVLIIKGVSGINQPDTLVTQQNIATIVLDDKQRNGETLYNAMAAQGLTMLIWLENRRKNGK